MAISLQDHETRIKDVELEIPKIQERIDGLVASGKDWAIVNLGTSTTIPADYVNYNVIVLSITMTAQGKSGSSTVTMTTNSVNKTGGEYSWIAWSFSKSNGRITIYIRNDSSGNNTLKSFSNLSVLFYK